jgi:hypothetical protein
MPSSRPSKRRGGFRQVHQDEDRQQDRNRPADHQPQPGPERAQIGSRQHQDHALQHEQESKDQRQRDEPAKHIRRQHDAQQDLQHAHAPRSNQDRPKGERSVKATCITPRRMNRKATSCSTNTEAA